MTWISTGLAVGVALGSSAGGWVDRRLRGARGVRGVPAVAGAVAVAVAFHWGTAALKRPAQRRGGAVEHARTGDGGSGRTERVA